MKKLTEEIHAFIATPTKKNFLWMMLGNGFYAACQWGMLIVLSKLGNPQVVGQFALALAIIAPVVMITNMQLRGVQATDAKKLFFLSDYVSVRIMSTLAAFVIILLILYFGRFDRAVFQATVILALAKSVESLSDVFYGFFQQNEKMGYIAISRIIKGILSVIVLGIIFQLSENLPSALVGLGCAWLLVFVIYDWRTAAKLLLVFEGPDRTGLIKTTINSIRERRGSLMRISLLAFPLGIVMGILSLNTNVPRYAIEKFLGTRDLGFFAALAYTTVAVNMFIQALGHAVTPRLARHFADKDISAFSKLLKKMVSINAVIGLCGIFVILIGGETILSIIYTNEYAAYTKLFLLLMASTTLTGIASAFGYAMTAARQFRPQVPLFIVVLFSTGLFSFILIPQLKLYGAALALMVSALIQIMGSVWIIKRAIKKCELART